jgi:hypothetical protein
MKTIGSILAVLVLSVVAFAGNARVTLKNELKYSLRLLVDNKFACVAPAKGDCAVLVPAGERYFSVTDLEGVTLQVSDHYVEANDEQIWIISCQNTTDSECQP